MACFLTPAAEAVVTSILKKSTKKLADGENAHKHPFIKRLGWLNNMLWGGSALLAFEHIWHGEIILRPPFLTGTANPAEMLGEIAVSGTSMAALITVVWAGMVVAVNALEKKSSRIMKKERG